MRVEEEGLGEMLEEGYGRDAMHDEGLRRLLKRRIAKERLRKRSNA